MYKLFKIMNVVCLVALILSLLLTSSDKTVSHYNTEADKTVELLSVTNEKDIELRYAADAGVLKGIILYFNVYSDNTPIENIEENGSIQYIVKKQSGDIVYSDRIYVEQIVREKSFGVLTGTELKMDIELETKDVLQVVLQGDNMPEGVSVAMLGNTKRNNTLVIIKNGVKYPDFPLFQAEVEKKAYKYTWDILFVWSILFVFSALVREKKDHDINKKKKSRTEYKN